VEYGTGENLETFPVWGSVVQKVFGRRHGLIDAYTTLHKVRMTGLEPGRTYRYRIVSKEMLQFEPYEVIFGDQITSDVYPFEVLDTQKDAFSFAVVADVHEQAEALDTILEPVSWDSMDMVFFAGDTLSWLDKEDQIFEGFIDVCVRRFASKTPLILIRGNHETRGHFARRLMDYFPNSSGRFYYSFNHGPVHFMVLDSGEDKPDSHPVYAGLVDFDRYREEQAEWLKKDVQSEAFKNSLYRIVVFHIPPFLDSDWHGPQDVTRRWGTILNDAEVDLVVSGHTHEYAYKAPTKDQNAFPIVVLGKLMFLKTDVSKQRLALSIADTNGTRVDQITLSPRPR
jgi:predicted phosphodiesterase